MGPRRNIGNYHKNATKTCFFSLLRSGDIIIKVWRKKKLTFAPLIGLDNFVLCYWPIFHGILRRSINMLQGYSLLCLVQFVMGSIESEMTATSENNPWSNLIWLRVTWSPLCPCPCANYSTSARTRDYFFWDTFHIVKDLPTRDKCDCECECEWEWEFCMPTVCQKNVRSRLIGTFRFC